MEDLLRKLEKQVYVDFFLALEDNDFNGGDVCMCYKIKGEEAKLLLFLQKP